MNSVFDLSLVATALMVHYHKFFYFIQVTTVVTKGQSRGTPFKIAGC